MWSQSDNSLSFILFYIYVKSYQSLVMEHEKKSTYVTWIAWGQFESDDSAQITAQKKSL